MLKHALLKEDFSVSIGISMLPSNLNLNIGRTKEHNNKNLVSNIGMKICSNTDINRDHKKLTPPDVPKKIVIPTAPHDSVGATIPHNLKVLTKKRNNEKLAITLLIAETDLIVYHFW